MPTNDVLGLSAYPVSFGVPPAKPTPEDFFDVALSYGKPIAIAETSAPSTPYTCSGTDYEVDEEYQRQYVDLLLRKAFEHEFAFVQYQFTIDYDLLYNKYPALFGEIAKMWMYTGLQTSGGKQKPAFTLWDKVLKEEMFFWWRWAGIS